MVTQYSLRIAATVLLVVGSTAGCQRSRHVQVHGVAHHLDVSGTADVRFDVRWPRAFRDSVSHAALWIFLKYRLGDGPWHHGRVFPAPAGSTLGDDHGVPAEWQATPDGAGLLASRAAPGAGPVRWDEVRVQWHNPPDSIPRGTHLAVRVHAIEMVYVPRGPFFAGDGDVGILAGHFHRAGAGEPYRIASEDSIVLGGDGGGLGNNGAYGMQANGGDATVQTQSPDDFDGASSAVLPAAFPKGVAAFYVMRYELTQGQYADFLTAMTPRQRESRDPAKAARGRVGPSIRGYTLSTVPPYVASVPDRPVHFVSWMDGAAYADWAGLRPMTELEFEKASRGPRFPEPGEYPWGGTEIARTRYSFVQAGDPMEYVTNTSPATGNAAYRGTMGGDGPSCSSCVRRPVPAGAFERDTAGPAAAGRSPYGAGELAGNLHEVVVSVGHAAGRRFDGRHGDGALDTDGFASGPEVAAWPGVEAAGGTYRVAGAAGTGLRGGSWASVRARLRTSDRALAAAPARERTSTTGIRLARTAPGR